MTASPDPEQSNFQFLQEYEPVFLQLASSAERLFVSDPNASLIKVRQFGEALAQELALRSGLTFDAQATQADLLHRLNREIGLDSRIKDLFHTLRMAGNRATHEFNTGHREALAGLKLARELAIWFHRAFGAKVTAFKPGPFVQPADPSAPLRTLHSEIEQLKARLLDANEQLDSNQKLAAMVAAEKTEYAQLAELMDDEARQLAATVKQQEAMLARERQDYQDKVAKLQRQLVELNQSQDPPSRQQRQDAAQRTQRATKSLTLSEDVTRLLIDQQLMEAGWQADSEALDYRKGARPEAGVNKAIAEWPGAGRERADYILFCGLMPIAAVEAKKENINVAGKITQAERYARGLNVASPLQGAWDTTAATEGWSDGCGGVFKVPFVYSCNGRPFVKQLAEQCGTWCRDVREPSHRARPLQQFHSPEGLQDKLKRSKAEAEALLQREGFAYLKLRDYQEKAVLTVERAMQEGRPHCLLAMATGTGKTRTIIGLIYRLLKSERCRRILFLVDRTALGEQAQDVFSEAILEQNQTLTTAYNVAELGDMAAEAETRVQVATVQAMVGRVFQSDQPPPVDTFDCIIVDEAHRGYTLDQEMTEGELETRDASQYLSSYRRVLDYFDAFKVGLTATPAKHTSEIFGKPVYTYSYREAVADDWLIDHEPPIRYETLLTQNGIHFDKAEQVSAINIHTGKVEVAELEDEVNFEVDAFNRRVINENFNRVICEQLAQELDPFGDEKTLIFCATDRHAEIVVRMLGGAMAELHGSQYNQAAVVKITGKSDKVAQLIRQFKNERYPNIAVTVDLLTTGIDVPSISHLVFMRRVKSRILFEQMVGRATRRCDDIGKTVFSIYDPVDIYAALQDVTTMQPLVKDPNITLEQLVDELTDPDQLQRGLNAPGGEGAATQAHVVLDQLSQKLMRVLRKAEKQAQTQPELKAKLDELHTAWGVPPAQLHQHLHDLGPTQAASFLQTHSSLLPQLADVTQRLGSYRYPLISNHDDQLLVREQSYGQYHRPEDYLDSFNRFVTEQLNQSAALGVVVGRPRDLTREQLKEIRLLLDSRGYAEATLKTAWRNRTNQEIAASIIGYIRQAALGEALIPFEQRVQRAMQAIYALQPWTQQQRKWLDRLAKQLTNEVILDRDTINQLPAFEGGANQLDKRLGKRLDEVLEGLREGLWQAS